MIQKMGNHFFLFIFFLRALEPWNSKLGSRFPNRRTKKEEKRERETKSRKLNTDMDDDHCVPPHMQNLYVRFEIQFTTATTKFEKSMSKTRNEWPSTATRLSFALDVSSCISWNRLSNRLPSTRDNLPSLTLLININSR